MAPMKPQPVTDESLTDAEAIRMVRGLASPSPRAGKQASEDRRSRQAVLTETVANEVIPRLVSAQRLKRLAAAPEPSPAVAAPEVDSLVALVLQGGLSEVGRYVEALQDAGLPAPQILLDLLAPAARRLGDMWCEDTVSFAEVTTGVMRLAKVMQLIGAAMEADAIIGPAAPRILLFQAPGEQHGFGLGMVAHFFRAAGFNVRNETAVTAEHAIDLVAREWFSMVGISVAGEDHFAAVGTLVASLRRASRNRALGILLGGYAFSGNPQSALALGADLPAMEGPDSVRAAHDLLSRLAREP